MQTQALTIHQALRSSRRILVLTGAGVSVASGIPDFKTLDTTWKHEIPRNEAMSIWHWKDEPQHFWEVYPDIFDAKIQKKPNAFHYYLTDLEENAMVTIATQNVDRMHHKAQSTHVIEFHGNMYENVCMECFSVTRAVLDLMHPVPMCKQCRVPLKPNISLFGEGVTGLGETTNILYEIDTLLVAGTSLKVGPFNDIPVYCEHLFPHVNRYLINAEPVSSDYTFNEQFIGTTEEYLRATLKSHD